MDNLNETLLNVFNELTRTNQNLTTLNRAYEKALKCQVRKNRRYSFVLAVLSGYTIYNIYKTYKTEHAEGV